MAASSRLRQAGRGYKRRLARRRVGHPPAKKGQPKTQVQKTEPGAPLARGARPVRYMVEMTDRAKTQRDAKAVASRRNVRHDKGRVALRNQ